MTSNKTSNKKVLNLTRGERQVILGMMLAQQGTASLMINAASIKQSIRANEMTQANVKSGDLYQQVEVVQYAFDAGAFAWLVDLFSTWEGFQGGLAEWCATLAGKLELEETKTEK